MNVKKMLQGRADSAYCKYIGQMQQRECLGVDYKLSNGLFGAAEFKAHCDAAQQLGAHQALAAAAAELPVWISVGERLPKLNEVVALKDENRWANTGSDWSPNVHMCGYLSDGGYTKYWSVFGEMRAQVLEAYTHWMALPVDSTTPGEPQ